MYKENKKEVRFKFGRNWNNYLNYLNDTQIQFSINSLKHMFSHQNPKGKTFLDIGCGSGLSSLSAVKLGYTVYSFDYDVDSVETSKRLKKKFSDNSNWKINQGSVLDKEYINSLGKFDYVYSWGVLHHTGKMYQSFSNIIDLVKDKGILFIAIYNDQGLRSIIWKKIKFVYSKFKILRVPLTFIFLIYFWVPKLILDLIKLKPFRSWIDYKKRRGMSPFFDVIDWIGGYPFEYAKPEEIILYFQNKGFCLENLKTCGGKLGCNEFVFKKTK